MAKVMTKPAGTTIDLTAEGISQADYLKAVHAIATGINAIRDKNTWCWVWIKFAAALNPLITQGVPVAGNSYYVKVTEPRPEDRYPQEWFNPEGWVKYTRDNQDAERMAELRRTYGRILQIVKDGHVSMEQAQELFRKAGLPAYTDGKPVPWNGVVEIFTNRRVQTEDITAEKKKINAAWQQFVTAVGWNDDVAVPVFSSYERGKAEVMIAAKDTEPLLGNPLKNYDPTILPDGTRLRG